MKTGFFDILNNMVLSIPFLWAFYLAIFLFLSYKKFNYLTYFAIFSILFLPLKINLGFWLIFWSISVLIIFEPIRQKTLTPCIIFLIKTLGLLPKISQTEKIALTSGTTWVDGELFSGNPDFQKIMALSYPKLSLEEQNFLDNEVEEVCKMCVDYEVQVLRDLPPSVWQYLRDKKFFGMIIPKQYGGLGFSAYAHSCVVEKLASRSVTLAITVMVPNSLGPAELLLHYGTKAQQDFYLPRLAVGADLPCFALTENNAGSDATSIQSNGVIFKNSDGEIKIRLNWNKRYITLGAYATIIGVAFQLRDPDKILSENTEIGITCALIPSSTSGVIQGRRHDPLATPFVNSPLNGRDVEIDFDAIIGGKDGIGKGWKMLMECLSAGRGISLPSTSSGGSKLVSRVVTAYAMVREQFGAPIAKFEGIEEVLARIASRTYALDAMRSFTAGSVDSGAKPAVISAIAKYHSTEMFRQNINDGMDICAGSAIIRGPRNILANPYFSTPISITVEGSNIMTRSLIQFGQGAIMSHPYAYKEIQALENNDKIAFDQAFFAHINHLFNNLSRSILLSLTRGYLYKPSKHDFVTKFERKISWCSATFAFLADVAMARFGGNLKRKEKINGRFGDALSAMYFATCILRKFKENNCPSSEKDIVEHALREQFSKAQYAIESLYQNLFNGFFGVIFKPFALFARFNAFVCPSSDKLSADIAEKICQNGELRDNLTRGVFVNDDKFDNLGRLENAFILKHKSLDILSKIKKAIKNKQLIKKDLRVNIAEALEQHIINSDEKNLLIEMLDACYDAILVDEYSLENYKKI
ncbi:MAG: acyl-CoA dehydrogenase [Alphaproteobacteria bacterium]|nr:acyl-CoA dehydrogenase [Alphaproteobacteria bacterium]